MRKAVRWSVYPRYTCGSPAQVDEATARRVAREERQGYEAAADGTYGEGHVQLARDMGLHNVVLCLTEVNGKFDVLDEMTGQFTTGVKATQFALDRVQEQVRARALKEGVFHGK